jgi:hypothetical protein
MKFKQKHALWLISIYKITISLIRIILGFIIIYFGFDLHKTITFLFGRGFLGFEKILLNLIIIHQEHINIVFTIILAISIISISILDIIFSIALVKVKKFGAIGLLITSILWIPVEILFVSKFLATPKIITILINLIIIITLIKIIFPKK